MKIGIDLGGTKTEIICLDDRRRERYCHRVAYPQHNYQETLSCIAQLIQGAEQYLDISATIGVGIPGSICQQQGIVKNANATWINGKPFKHDLEHLLNREIRVANDANCFTLSEATDGAAANYSTVFGVIIGTGCGGGLVVDQKVLVGANGLTGEWGHNPLPFPQLLSTSVNTELHHFFDAQDQTQVAHIYRHKHPINTLVSSVEDSEYPGPMCYCGKRGCLETWLSGPALAADYRRASQRHVVAEEIVARAYEGEPDAEASLQRYYERLAKSLAQLINVIDPDAIVLGGGMSNIESLYTEIPRRWSRYIFSDTSTTPLLKAQYGDSSGVRGAAFLWDN